MTKMILLFTIAVVLFSAAAGASWYLQSQDAPPAGDKEEKSHKAAAPDPHHVKEVKLEAPARPLLRAPVSPEADRLTRMADTLQVQQESLRGREKHIADREKQLELIHEEIKQDQKKLDAVRKDIEAEMQLVQEKLELLEKRAGDSKDDRLKADAQLEDIRRTTLEINSVETKNLKQMANIYDKMDPEAAAQNLQQMTEKGKLDTAVAILANMRDRQAANVLGEISKQDPSVAVELFDRMRYMKAPVAAAKK